MSNASEKSLTWDGFGKIGVWILEHSPKTLFAILIASLFLIFAPHWLIHRMGLGGISLSNSLIPGLGAVISGALLLAHGGAWAIASLQKQYKIRCAKKYLHFLTAPERRELQPFFDHRTKTCYLDASSGIVKGLEAKGILSQVSNILRNPNMAPTTYAFNLEDWAWDEIIFHPSILDLTTSL